MTYTQSYSTVYGHFEAPWERRMTAVELRYLVSYPLGGHVVIRLYTTKAPRFSYGVGLCAVVMIVTMYCSVLINSCTACIRIPIDQVSLPVPHDGRYILYVFPSL